MLPCTREHDFRKIAVFVVGPHFGQISGDFTSVLDPKSQQKHLRKRFRENLGFRSPFFVVFHDFWTPFGTPFGSQNHPKTLPGRSRATFRTFRGIRGRFWSLRGWFWEPPGSILEPPGLILEPPGVVLGAQGTSKQPQGHSNDAPSPHVPPIIRPSDAQATLRPWDPDEGPASQSASQSPASQPPASQTNR